MVHSRVLVKLFWHYSELTRHPDQNAKLRVNTKRRFKSSILNEKDVNTRMLRWQDVCLDIYHFEE